MPSLQGLRHSLLSQKGSAYCSFPRWKRATAAPRRTAPAASFAPRASLYEQVGLRPEQWLLQPVVLTCFAGWMIEERTLTQSHGPHYARRSANHKQLHTPQAAPIPVTSRSESIEEDAEPIAVQRNPLNDGRDACGVGFIARIGGQREHSVLLEALNAVGCVEHRGACSADNDSGDGAGVMTEIPWKLFNRWLIEQGLQQVEEGSSAAGMVFLPKDDEKRAKSRAIIQGALEREGLELISWRTPPIDRNVLGTYAAAAEPSIEQLLVTDTKGRSRDDIERALFLAKKAAEREVLESGDQEMLSLTYICSLSTRTMVYKGMLRSAVLPYYFLDLQDSDYETNWAIYHRRFSTNTSPAWPLAQPFRMVGHNGEINTLMGNLNWVRTREGDFQHPLWAGREEDLRPVVDPSASDSANLDRLAELLVNTERPLEETMMLLVPEAHKQNPKLDNEYPEARDFYDFYSGTQEAWDGPALLVFCDGTKLGCRLDRNGLRPARFWYTSDTVYVASEVGVQSDVLGQAADVKTKGRIGPGQMVIMDLEKGEFKEHAQVAREVAQQRPYSEWLKERMHLPEPSALQDLQVSNDWLVALQAAAGWSSEDISMILEAMATDGKEPVFCMGDDSPLSPLSGLPHSLFNYFKQRFAQVTNPAIDPLREGMVMSLEMTLGGRGDLLQPSEKDARQLVIDSPILLEEDVNNVKEHDVLNTTTLLALFDGHKEGGLKEALDDLCRRAEDAVVNQGSKCLVITDKTEEVDPERPAIPALLAVGAVHHHLIARKVRSQCSIVSENMHAQSTHHIACLVGYGAEAVHPWLALESVRAWRLSRRTQNLIEKGKMTPVTIEEAQFNVKKALESGLLKILSKMGIGLVSSYHGAQIFECFGLHQEVVDFAFAGTESRVGGLTFEELASEVKEFWRNATPGLSKLPAQGFFQPKPGLEYHGNNQEMAKLLHQSIGLGGKEPSSEAYDLYMEHRSTRPVTTLRDCLDIKSDRGPIDVSEVESVTSICERFCTGGMSLGAISRECHEVIGIAMNRIGGKSNSGEGGEDPDRYISLNDVDENGQSPTLPHLRGLQNGDYASSAIKQVASGRFGVTPEFLAASKQLEIKIAQGAKPGEGGQLPGKKVSPYIAKLRRSKPGVPLISPPPHHDIYSIEDLAQLIFDLHQANSESRVSVKLVAQDGIGTVASGVAKANADIIQVSGHDGGTGASPVSSIKHAGAPFELGLMETHEALLENGLRDRVVLRTDGGMRSGYDVLQAALLGADEFGFGTVSMIATGCIMARVCHTNNCPVGVASQREELRARFPGAPSDLVNFFHFVAEEVRQALASMGYRSLDEVIGRSDLLSQRSNAVRKTQNLDLSYLTRDIGLPESLSSDRCQRAAHSNGPVFDDALIADRDISYAIENEESISKEMQVTNVDRGVGGRLGPYIAGKHGDHGFAGSIDIKYTGAAGQSFGAWLVQGVHFSLEGEANDYVGKGMAGGSIAVMPPSERGFPAEEANVVGNTCLYGATGGRLFVNGRAGERFAVRNSMAEAIVEGTGDHCCEYMTGGTVVVLGPVGRNTGAGMTGGIAYIYDEDDSLPSLVNHEIVSMQRVQTQAGELQLRHLIQDHAQRTGSARAHSFLAAWDTALPKFWQLVPPSEADTPEASPEASAADEHAGAAAATA